MYVERVYYLSIQFNSPTKLNLMNQCAEIFCPWELLNLWYHYQSADQTIIALICSPA